MNIKFELKISDYILFYKRIYKKKNILFQNVIFLISFGFALYLGLNKLNFNFIIINSLKVPGSLIGDSILLSIMYNLILMIGLIYLLRYFFIKSIENRVKRNPYLIGEKEIILSDDKIIIKSISSVKEFSINSIYNIEVIPDYSYITIDEQTVIIVPSFVQGYKELISKLNEKQTTR